MAGLNFPGNAVYSKVQTGKDNIAQFEFIPWILGQCANVQEARVLLSHINLVDTPFNEKYPVSPLHWILADKEEAITIESVQEGLKIYDNPVGVLTNNPPVSNPDVSFERLYVPVFRITDKPFFRRSEAEAVQQRHGSHGTARGSVFCIPFCTGGIHEDEFPVRIV